MSLASDHDGNPTSSDSNDCSQKAIDKFLPLVYEQLRIVATRQFEGQRSDHTLQPTALVHEAYLRLVDQQEDAWASKAHFVAVAATAIRSVLTDHLRSRRAAKRGGHWRKVPLDTAGVEFADQTIDLLALDEALTKLAQFAPRQCRIVELRFFGGITMEQISEILQVSIPTVERDWRVARLWLLRELNKGIVDDT